MAQIITAMKLPAGIALALFAALASAAEWKTATVSGQVTNLAGKPLAGAKIAINRSRGREKRGHH